ncbi:hypothetical protein JK202_13610 [Gluconobacter sp. Dm-62]|uniref:hypothetical protein n=1 Tax=Gluconobacter sp. Dm-62 TaxID=2799804 RepID=UPI001B8AE961|nr:hypothetical protein [Gluconobacter sp. Dm-62]MBS1104031.1 hypothetical protein [Gluconobacter sp. Dm-62]
MKILPASLRLLLSEKNDILDVVGRERRSDQEKGPWYKGKCCSVHPSHWSYTGEGLTSANRWSREYYLTWFGYFEAFSPSERWQMEEEASRHDAVSGWLSEDGPVCISGTLQMRWGPDLVQELSLVAMMPIF